MPTYRNREQSIYTGDFALYKHKDRHLPYLVPVQIKHIKFLPDDRIQIHFTDGQIAYVEDWQDDLEFYYFESDADHLLGFYDAYCQHQKQQIATDEAEANFAYAVLIQVLSYRTNDDAQATKFMREAVDYFKQASDLWHAESSYLLADMHRRITNPIYQSCFEPNRELKFQDYLLKSAEQGHALGQYQLAYFYEYGKYGFIADIKKAVFWYQQSADQDYPLALNNLGDKYEKAKGVARNYQHAAMYYQRSAKHDVPEAMYNLGRLYLRGLGLEKDVQKGRDLIQKAANRYHQGAIKKLRDLDNKSV